MAPKRKTHFSNVEIEQMLAEITLADTAAASSSSDRAVATSVENFEPLGPLVRQLHQTQSTALFLRSLSSFVTDQESAIEAICTENYLDFTSSVSTLLSVRQGTVHLRHRIAELDAQMGEVGRALLEKKRRAVEERAVRERVDEGVEALRGAMELLEGVQRVGSLIEGGKSWSALRSLDELTHYPVSSTLSTTPLYAHIQSRLPLLRQTLKSKVTSSLKTWLFDIRQSSGLLGRLATDEMRRRERRWRARRDRDVVGAGGKGAGGVGSAVEEGVNEKNEFDIFNNDQIKIDFKPLYECVHIYTALNSLPELQATYQADRRTQASLILSPHTRLSPETLLQTLPTLLEQLLGFFLVESHVLQTTAASSAGAKSFRRREDVDALWLEMGGRVKDAVRSGLEGCQEMEIWRGVKAGIGMFVQALEIHGFVPDQLNDLLGTLFERYLGLLQSQYSSTLTSTVERDDLQPMVIDGPEDLDRVLKICWMPNGFAQRLQKRSFPLEMPFSQAYAAACIDIRSFVDGFYSFIDGLPNTSASDALLGGALDELLSKHVARTMEAMLAGIGSLTQIAQLVVNMEFFRLAAEKLEGSLANIRADMSAPPIKLGSIGAFNGTLVAAEMRISRIIASKLDQFFELAEVEWTPPTKRPPGEPSGYLLDMVEFLKNFVGEGLSGLEAGRQGAIWRGACQYIAKTWMDWLEGDDVPAVNENGLCDIKSDASFIEAEMARIGKPELGAVFDELKLTITIILSDSVKSYLNQPTFRRTSAVVQPMRLAVILNKVARHGLAAGAGAGKVYEKAQQRRAESDAVRRLGSVSVGGSSAPGSRAGTPAQA